MTTDTKVKLYTSTDIHEVLIDIVIEDPDHVDPRTPSEVRPRYMGETAPNCLVGNVLAALGFGVDVLRELDAEFPLGELLSSGIRIGESTNPALQRFELDALALLVFLQDGQDAGLTWFQCLAHAFAKPSRFIPAKYVKERRPWLF